VPEAEVLSKRKIAGAEDVREAARAIHALGPRIVIIKGGHLDGPAVDLVFDGETFTPIEGERVDTKNTHGTGCTYSAAITALLALGLPELEAIQLAKRYIEAALRNSYPIGAGHSPVNHATTLPESIQRAIRPRVNG
jgi:hydroxymethylpyrimidine/phosphomethylpyrimidine kinase